MKVTCALVFSFEFGKIYLLGEYLFFPSQGWCASTSMKGKRMGRQGRRAKKRKVMEAQRLTPPIPSQVSDVLIGNKENKKWKKKKLNEPPNPAILDPSVTSTYRDHTVSLFF